MADRKTADKRSARQTDGSPNGGEQKRDLPDPGTARELLETMALIRRFEEEAGRQYMRAKVGGFLHLAIGEEATIVGSCAALRDEDYLISTYRSHGHAIARGTHPNAVMAELFGRQDGCSGGRGGSMHMFDLENRFMGGYGIVGGNLPLAAGFALASDYRGEDSVTLCMFGDGASNQGTFGETMNLAALWKLPIVFLVENNLYGMGTSLERHSAVTDLSKKAECLGVPGEKIDGMDVLGVRECVEDHVRQAREDRRPTMIEAVTYRFRGHSAADPEEYRSEDEVREWEQRDPIRAFERRLVDDDVLSDGDVEEIHSRANEIVEKAVEFADASPEPPLESLYENLYVVGDQIGAWYAVDERTPDVHRGEREHEVGRSGQPRDLAEKGAAYAGQSPVKSEQPQERETASDEAQAEGLASDEEESE